MRQYCKLTIWMRLRLVRMRPESYASILFHSKISRKRSHLNTGSTLYFVMKATGANLAKHVFQNMKSKEAALNLELSFCLNIFRWSFFKKASNCHNKLITTYCNHSRTQCLSKMLSSESSRGSERISVQTFHKITSVSWVKCYFTINVVFYIK